MVLRRPYQAAGPIGWRRSGGSFPVHRIYQAFCPYFSGLRVGEISITLLDDKPRKFSRADRHLEIVFGPSRSLPPFEPFRPVSAGAGHADMPCAEPEESGGVWVHRISFLSASRRAIIEANRAASRLRMRSMSASRLSIRSFASVMNSSGSYSPGRAALRHGGITGYREAAAGKSKSSSAALRASLHSPSVLRDFSVRIGRLLAGRSACRFSRACFAA
jgi:hypothetical protein